MTNHLKKASTAVVVLCVYLKVLVERVDAVCENRDLYLGRTCVALMDSVLFDDFLLDFLCDHFLHLNKIFS